MQKPNDDFQERLNEAAEDVNDIIENADFFSYDDIEQAMLSHGLEMDYILDILG